MDKQQLCEMDNLEDNHQPTPNQDDSKKQPQSPKFVKIGTIIFVVVMFIMSLFLFLILLMTGLIFNHLNTQQPAAPCNEGSTSPLTAPVSGLVPKNSSCATIFSKLQDMESKMNKIAITLDDQTDANQNVTSAIQRIARASSTSVEKLINIVGTLSHIKDSSISSANVIDDILLLVEELIAQHNESAVLPGSCQELLKMQPRSPSGYYTLLPPNSNTILKTYCSMEELCGSGGGWMRLAYLDMSDSTEMCPPGFRRYSLGSTRVCGRAYSFASCQSVIFPSNGISYSQVCGRVVGYQYGSTDAFAALFANKNNINTYYVDGVSITRGSPRQHVWTLAAGYNSYSNEHPNANCPCTLNSTQKVSSFVSDNYFCEADRPKLYNNRWPYSQPASDPDDPLWDGKGCSSRETACCSAPGLPWFHRDYGEYTTTDYLELRVCSDETAYNEDVPVEFYEIYVK